MNRSAFPACCGASIISGFSCSPTDAASFKMAKPDPAKPQGRWDPPQYEKDAKGNPVVDKTHKDLFLAKLKEVGYKDHLFSVILTKGQYEVNNEAWPKVLKEAGFEFVTAFNNSVHTKSTCYLFVFARAETGNAPQNPKTPPKGWETLASGVKTDGEAKAA